MATAAPKNNLPVSRILTKDLIIIGPGARDKSSLVEQLVAKLAAARSLKNPKELLEKITMREKSINTTLDTGLSIPHARIDGVTEIVGVLALLPKSIPDPADPNLMIRAVLLFFVPTAQEWAAKHLQLLRTVAMIFQPEFIDKLVTAKTPADVLELIRKKEGS